MSDRSLDPYGSFNFVVEIDGIVSGGFSQIGGLERTTAIEDYREGGVNDYVHRIVGVTTYPNLVLRRGLADRYELWAWHQEVVGGIVRKRDVSVLIKGRAAGQEYRLVFERAFPVKWSGSELDAAASAVVVESVELTHEGMTQVV
jgi:phage tail-like protein